MEAMGDRSKDSCFHPQGIFACGCTIVLTPIVEKTVLSPLSCLGTFVKNQSSIYVWVHFWTLFCGSICLFDANAKCFDYCNFVIKFEIEIWVL